MDATIFVHSYHLAIIIHCLCLLGFYIAILFSVTTGTYGTEKKYPASITKHCTEYFHHWSWYVLCPSSTPDCYWSLCVQFSVLCPLFCWPLTLLSLFFCLLYPCSTGGGYTVLPLSFRPSKEIFLHIFLSNYWWQKSDIWSQASYRYPISWEAFLDPSDSYFLFADLVGFYTHWTYMHIFCRIFLSNYWWQESDIWSQASYRYAVSDLEICFVLHPIIFCRTYSNCAGPELTKF